MSFYTLEDFHSNNHLFELTMSAAFERKKKKNLIWEPGGLALPFHVSIDSASHSISQGLGFLIHCEKARKTSFWTWSRHSAQRWPLPLISLLQNPHELGTNISLFLEMKKLGLSAIEVVYMKSHLS